MWQTQCPTYKQVWLVCSTHTNKPFTKVVICTEKTHSQSLIQIPLRWIWWNLSSSYISPQFRLKNESYLILNFPHLYWNSQIFTNFAPMNGNHSDYNLYCLCLLGKIWNIQETLVLILMCIILTKFLYWMTILWTRDQLVNHRVKQS